LFINYLHYNTDINLGSLVPLALSKTDDFDYKDLFEDAVYVENITYSNPNLTIEKIVMSLNALRKPVIIDQLCDGFCEGIKIHLTGFEKWLQSIDCQLLPNELHDFFYYYLKSNSMGYAGISRLQQAVELGYSHVSLYYDK
jgi:hypothetical protein